MEIGPHRAVFPVLPAIVVVMAGLPKRRAGSAGSEKVLPFDWRDIVPVLTFIALNSVKPLQICPPHIGHRKISPE